MEKEERKSLATVIVDILDLGKIGGENATNFLKRFLEFLNTDENRENNDEAESKIPTQLRKHIRAIIIRYFCFCFLYKSYFIYNLLYF